VQSIATQEDTHGNDRTASGDEKHEHEFDAGMGRLITCMHLSSSTQLTVVIASGDMEVLPIALIES